MSRMISIGARVALIGYITSGPLGFMLVQVVKPQPAWSSSAVFAENYHFVQDVPFYFGFLLVGGMLMLAVGHYLNYKESDDEKKFHLLVALGWTIAFFAMVSFNYVCQTTFVRHMAQNYKPEYDSAIAIFSMANPMSFCWANEMWGYGFLGVATWLTAGYYKGKSNSIRLLLIANGIVSVSTVVATVINVSWVLTTFGLVAYFLWNLLMIVLMTLIYRHSRRIPKVHT